MIKAPVPGARALRYRFDRFLLTDDRLTEQGATVRLAAKPLGVLRTLVTNAGRLTTKQDLVETVWPDRAVSDESIARSVFLVRQALGELDARPARFIETVYGRGYRFVAEVVAEPDERPHVQRAPIASTDAERAALNFCIEARYRLSRRAGNLGEALRLYEQAIEIAPGFRPARIGMAECSLWLAQNGLLAPLTAAARARSQLREALAADPDDPRAHATLGMLSSYFDWDVAAADAAFGVALETDPADPVVHAFLGRHYASLCRWPEARDAMDAALALEPASMVVRNVRAFVASCAGDTDFALAEIRTSMELEPTHPNPKFFYAVIAAGGGRGEEAYAVARDLHAHADQVPVLRSIIGYAAACVGDEAEVRASLDFVTAAARTRYVIPTSVAFIHARRGDFDAAFRWLDRAIEERCAWLALANALPGLAPLRRDRRFARIRTAIGRG
jgi:DNA-binding winged helix-turn-helix (wHTH) protein/cytochrome c-type biogenesis protein CcmH/NrfG